MTSNINNAITVPAATATATATTVANAEKQPLLTTTHQGFFEKHPNSKIGLTAAVLASLPTAFVSLFVFAIYYKIQQHLDIKNEEEKMEFLGEYFSRFNH